MEKIARFVSTRMPRMRLELCRTTGWARQVRAIWQQDDLGDVQPPKEEQMQTFREVVSRHGLALRYS